MHIVWTEILHPAHFLLATDFCCKTRTDGGDAAATEPAVRSLGGFEREILFQPQGGAVAHQGLGHAVLFANIAEVSGAAGLKPDMIPKLGVVLPTTAQGALCCQYVAIRLFQRSLYQ